MLAVSGQLNEKPPVGSPSRAPAKAPPAAAGRSAAAATPRRERPAQREPLDLHAHRPRQPARSAGPLRRTGPEPHRRRPADHDRPGAGPVPSEQPVRDPLRGRRGRQAHEGHDHRHRAHPAGVPEFLRPPADGERTGERREVPEGVPGPTREGPRARFAARAGDVEPPSARRSSPVRNFSIGSNPALGHNGAPAWNPLFDHASAADAERLRVPKLRKKLQTDQGEGQTIPCPYCEEPFQLSREHAASKNAASELLFRLAIPIGYVLFVAVPLGLTVWYLSTRMEEKPKEAVEAIARTRTGEPQRAEAARAATAGPTAAKGGSRPRPTRTSREAIPNRSPRRPRRKPSRRSPTRGCG